MAFVLTGPVWWTPEAYLGDVDDSDLHGSIWAYWWSAFSLQSGLNPFDGSYNFFPVGQAPVSQYNILDGLLAAPLVALFGIRVGFNLAGAAVLAGVGGAMALLARSARLTPAGAIAAGVGMECSAHVLFHLGSGRPTQALVVFQLLALAGVLRLLQGDQSRWTPVWTGATAAAAALTYWYSLAFFLVAALVLGLSELRSVTAAIGRRLVLSAAIGAAIVLPFLLRLVDHFESLPGVGRGSNVERSFGVEAAIESSQWPIWPLFETPFTDSYSLSPVLLFFAIAGVVTARKTARPWLLLIGIGWVFSLGPYLRWAETGASGISLPFLWVQEGVPFMERLWWPERWSVLCAIGLSLLAGRGVENVLKHRGGLSVQSLTAVVVLLLVGSGFARGSLFVDWSKIGGGGTALYEGLEGPVLSTPIEGDSYTAGSVLLSQVFHQQPTNNGLGQHLSQHRPQEYDRWVESNELVSALVSMERGVHQRVWIQPEAVEDLLNEGFRSVLVDPSNFTKGFSQQWATTYIEAFTAIWGEPDHRSGGGAWWRITPITDPVEVRLQFVRRGGRAVSQ